MSDENEVVEVVELAPEELAEVAGGAVPDPFILGGKQASSGPAWIGGRGDFMIDLDKLRSVLSYDPETGIFYWVKDSGRARAGSIAGGMSPKGYWRIGIYGRRYLAHQLAWFLFFGEFPKLEIDHKNRRRSDNRIENLRLATHRQNMWNMAVTSRSTTGLKGIYRMKDCDRWQVKIAHKYIGLFKTKKAAIEAHALASKENYGEFAA